jgi:outer membrane lipoprotein SlyB
MAKGYLKKMGFIPQTIEELAAESKQKNLEKQNLAQQQQQPIAAPKTPTPKPLPAGYTQDPNFPNQMNKQLSQGTTETKATPDYANLAKAKARIRGDVPLPPETQVEKQALIEQNNAQNQEEIAQLGILTPEQMNRDIASDGMAGTAFQTAKIAGATAAGGLAGGGAIGGTIGATIGSIIPGAGTAVGAVIGATIGGVGATYVTTLRKKRDNVDEAMALYVGSKSNLKFIINEVNAGRMSGDTAVDLWNNNLANYRIAQQHMKELTDTDMDRFLSKGLNDYETLMAFGETIPYRQSLLTQAIINPDPSKVTYDLPE